MAEPRITRAEVEDVARLARLQLSPEELERMRRELDAILVYIDKLRDLDTTDVAPTSHAVPLTNAMREDTLRPPFPAADMLANAPERAADLFRVPRIIED
jgi:aspartyl-tRNA(Asn)/glutamyl-tRNA(Gln) amidotransferase subunit C